MWKRWFGYVAIILVTIVVVIIMMTIFGARDSDIDAYSYNLTSALNGEADSDGSGLTANDLLVAYQSGTSETALFNSQQRVILRNASLSLTVEDPESKLSEISALATELGGWVVSSNLNRFTNSAEKDTARGTITVRVPAERLDEALERIKAGAKTVNSENVTGQDVTQEYVDLSSRLKNLEAAESQLQKIMDSATKVEDVLAVHAELTRIRGDIESIRGQLQYYDQAAAFSSIAVDLTPETPGVIQSQTGGWNPASTAESAFGALVRALQITIDIVIALVIFLGPFVVVIGIPGWWIYRRYWRTRPKKPNTSE